MNDSGEEEKKTRRWAFSYDLRFAPRHALNSIAMALHGEEQRLGKHLLKFHRIQGSSVLPLLFRKNKQVYIHRGRFL